MKPMPDQSLEKVRDIGWELSFSGSTGAGTGTGRFRIRHKGAVLRIIASADECWEHVSVSVKDRCPTWDEMCIVKSMFWRADEAAFQLHPPESDYVNNHPYCLHLWRPTREAIPMPPSIYVGVKDAGVLRTPEEARALLRAQGKAP